jgi:hypothetical protein
LLQRKTKRIEIKASEGKDEEGRFCVYASGKDDGNKREKMEG